MSASLPKKPRASPPIPRGWIILAMAFGAWLVLIVALVVICGPAIKLGFALMAGM